MAKRPSLSTVMEKGTEKPMTPIPPEPAPVTQETAPPPMSNRKPGKKQLGWVQFNTYVPEDLRKQAKIKATREDVDLSDVVSELLQKWVEE